VGLEDLGRPFVPHLEEPTSERANDGETKSFEIEDEEFGGITEAGVARPGVSEGGRS
jgi:hypothetical protein